MAKLTDRLKDVLPSTGLSALEQAFGIATVRDLLLHYPRRYARRGDLTELETLVPGEVASIMAEIRRSQTIPMGRDGRGKERSRTVLAVTDGTDELAITFFNAHWRDRKGEFVIGRRGLFSGKVGTYRGEPQMSNPEVEWSPDTFDDPDAAEAWANAVVPVYPATAKIKSDAIRKLVETVLVMLDPVDDPLPAGVRTHRRLIGLDAAIRDIHVPEQLDDVRPARRRLAFDEAFHLQLLLAQRRHELAGVPAVPRPGTPDGLLAEFDASSGLSLTAGQHRVGSEISADMSRTHPMHRLLQGDVGSGKTLVALRAMLQCIDSGGQAVLLAPTEVLAQQHAASLRRMLGGLAQGGMLGGSDHATRVALLTGSMATAARRAALLDIVTGAAGIVVGTHALLQESVEYHDLGLIVVDEQHRFGVEQRAALVERSGGARPHLLVMTATPIPRTVAMTVFGDLDTSVMKDRPAGAPDIATHVVGERDQPRFVDRAWQRAVEEVSAGRQVFVVASRIDEKDDDGAGGTDLLDELGSPTPHAVTVLADELAAGPLASVRIGVLHGRMAPEDKDDTMRRFTVGPTGAEGIDVLVSTTVIEVGVDIQQASMMVIMDADRFGVSQLHQLRGRVGRAGQPAVCLLVTQADPGSPARDRLSQIAATTDGFQLARLDLELRREGDVLGAAQSGRRSSLRLLSVLRDEDLINDAREDAAEVVAADPELLGHPLLAGEVRALADEERAEYLDKT